MNVVLSPLETALARLVPEPYPEAKCITALPNAERDRLRLKIEDVAFACEASYERQLDKAPGDLAPDAHTKQQLSRAGPAALELMDELDNSTWSPRLLRLRGVVCAAEIVADTYTATKDCGSYEDCALENAIEISRDYARMLLAEARAMQ